MRWLRIHQNENNYKIIYLIRNILIYHYFQIQKTYRIYLKVYIKTICLLFYNINLRIIIMLIK